MSLPIRRAARLGVDLSFFPNWLHSVSDEELRRTDPASLTAAERRRCCELLLGERAKLVGVETSTRRADKTQQEQLSAAESRGPAELVEDVQNLTVSLGESSGTIVDEIHREKWLTGIAMELSASQLKKRLRYLKDHDNYPDHSGEYDDIFLKSDQCVESSLAPHEFTRRQLLLACDGADIPMGKDWICTDGKNDLQLRILTVNACTVTQKHRRRLVMGLPEFKIHLRDPNLFKGATTDETKHTEKKPNFSRMKLDTFICKHYTWTNADKENIDGKQIQDLIMAINCDGMTEAQLEARKKGRARASDAKYRKVRKPKGPAFKKQQRKIR